MTFNILKLFPRFFKLKRREHLTFSKSLQKKIPLNLKKDEVESKYENTELNSAYFYVSYIRSGT